MKDSRKATQRLAARLGYVAAPRGGYMTPAERDAAQKAIDKAAQHIEAARKGVTDDK